MSGASHGLFSRLDRKSALANIVNLQGKGLPERQSGFRGRSGGADVYLTQDGAQSVSRQTSSYMFCLLA